MKSAPTSEWAGGERYTPASVYYHQVRGVVTGTKPGDSVEVWFEGGGEKSPSFTYQAVSESSRRVLVVAAEDYTGASPVQSPGPHYASYYLDALAANGTPADLYDIDARGRVAPDALGVLSHYDAVVWYGGDDIVTRRTGWGPGNADRLALDELLEFRAYLNEGGKVLYTGDFAGEQYTGNVGSQLYDPKGADRVQPVAHGSRRTPLPAPRGFGRRHQRRSPVLLRRLRGHRGRRARRPREGLRPGGVDTPFDGLEWGLNGRQSAKNQDDTSSFLATSGLLPTSDFPQFESWPSSRWVKPGGPFEPHTGTKYVYSQVADVSYKRLTRDVSVPAGGGSLSFWTSYDTEPDWDYLFVEARTPGGDDWTTLPDANGHTATATGESCAAGWVDLHPQLAHYQTWDGVGSCTGTGTTGAWNAATGNSSGWQEWDVDLSAWAGKTAEVSIAYASDWATQGVGAFVDDVTLPGGSTESFEGDLGGWTVSGPPTGSATNANDWVRTDSSSFPVGSSITTPDTVLMGSGIEGITLQSQQAVVLGAAVKYLLQ